MQQTASFVAQNGARGRSRADLLDLAQAVWPESPHRTAGEIVDGLVEQGYLEERRDRLFLGEPWADAFDKGSGGMHANLDSSVPGIPVVDAGTGEVIATVAQTPHTNKGLALGGQIWDARHVDGEVLLSPRQPGPPRAGFRYAARSAPTGAEFAVHVRRGLGFNDVDAPIVMFDEGPVWLHFGGSGYEIALLKLFPSLRTRAGLAGLAVSGRLTADQLCRTAARENVLLDALEAVVQSLESTLSAGPYHRLLPESCRRRITTDLFDMRRFRTWIANRQVWELPPDDRRLDAVRTALAEHP